MYPIDYTMSRSLKNRGQVATVLQALCNSMVKVADIIDMLNLSIGEELLQLTTLRGARIRLDCST